MNNPSGIKYANLWKILIGITLFRIIYLAINFRPLNVDEAQYWLWSQHLSLGYHSKPPLIAYVIFTTSHILGNGYFGIRFIVPICYFFTAYFLYLSAKKIFSREIAKWTALSFIFFPSIAFSSTIISTDPLMLMFWALALYFFVCAMKTEKLLYWILLGIAVGLSVLSKYTGLVFLLSLFLYLLFFPSVRSYLRSAKLYIMLAVVILIISPNIIWNISNGFITFKHVVYHNADIHGLQFHPLNLSNFMASQLAVFSIVFMCIYIYSVWQKKYWQDMNFCLLWMFSLPMLTMIIIEAAISRAYANWAVAAYLSGTILVCAILVNKRAIGWLKFNLGYCFIAMLILYGFDFGIMHQIISLKNYPHFYKKLFGWEYAGQEINFLHKKYPTAKFVMTNREIWSKSAYFGKLPLNKIFTISSIKKIECKNCILLTDENYTPNYLKNYFSHSTRLPAITLEQFGKKFGEINAFHLTNFNRKNDKQKKIFY